MANKTLLNGVNEVLKRVQVIDADGELSTLTDSARQVFIDTAVQVWNELVEELYTSDLLAKPNELAEDTITLSTNDRDYALASDLLQLRWPLLDETNGRYITEYPGGYEALVRDQPFPSNETGLPLHGAIRPTDGQLYLDKLPTSNENGLVYKYRYDKDVSLSSASDTFPFSDAVFRALVPAAAEVWKLEQKSSFNAGLFKTSMGRASRLLLKGVPGGSWAPIRYKVHTMADPFDA